MVIFDIMRTIWIIIRKAVTRWINHNATTHGAALAFFAILSIAPLAIISIRIIGAVYGENAAKGQIVDQIEAFTGRDAAMTIQSVIESTNRSRAGSTATLVGVGMLFFGASAVFSQVQESLNMIWGMKEQRGMGILDFLQRRAISVAMTIGVGCLLLASLVVSTWLAAAERLVEGVLPSDSGAEQWLNFAVSFAVLTILFALIFKWLPDTKIAWKDVWAGSVITALLFLAGKYFIGVYLGRSAIASAYGAAGSFIAVIIWVYYSSLIFYFGAELTHAYASVVGSHKHHPLTKNKDGARQSVPPAT